MEITLVISSLSVIAATISGLVATILLKQHKDKERPYISIEPNYDRYGFIQIEVRNDGTETAIIKSVESSVELNLLHGQSLFIELQSVVIPSQHSIKYPLLPIAEYSDKSAEYNSHGTIHYTNIGNKKYKNPFIFNIEGQDGSFWHDEESIKTHFELQKIPKEIKKVGKKLERIKED